MLEISAGVLCPLYHCGFCGQNKAAFFQENTVCSYVDSNCELVSIANITVLV